MSLSTAPSLYISKDVFCLDSSQFGTLMNCELFEHVRTKFCVANIDIPGMEPGDSAVQAGCYPTADQMAEMIPFVSTTYLNGQISGFNLSV